MRVVRGFAVGLLALAGCLQNQTVVKLNPDGSGTIEETTLMSDQVIEMMAGFANAAADPDAPAPAAPEMFKESDAKEKAEKMGEGVTFVSMEKIKADGFQGMKAVYAFTDITKVRLSTSPSAPSSMGPQPAGNESEPMEVKFQKGSGSSTLTIVLKRKGDEAKEVPADAKAEAEKALEENAADETQLAQMQQMLKGMKFGLAVEVGKVVKTNSPYVDGGRVTVFEIDFEKVLKDPAKLKLLAKKQPKTLEETREILAGIEGIKFPAEQELTIEFSK